jgi:hypothetical protein
VRSAISGVDTVGRREVLGAPLARTIPFLPRYGASISRGFVLTSSLAAVRTVSGRLAYTCAVGITMPVSRRHCSSHLNIVTHRPIARQRFGKHSPSEA